MSCTDHSSTEQHTFSIGLTPECEPCVIMYIGNSSKDWTIILERRKYEKLKEYYEIVDEARPLSGFFPTHADFFTEMHF